MNNIEEAIDLMFVEGKDKKSLVFYPWGKKKSGITIIDRKIAKKIKSQIRIFLYILAATIVVGPLLDVLPSLIFILFYFILYVLWAFSIRYYYDRTNVN